MFLNIMKVFVVEPPSWSNLTNFANSILSKSENYVGKKNPSCGMECKILHFSFQKAKCCKISFYVCFCINEWLHTYTRTLISYESYELHIQSKPPNWLAKLL